MQYSRRRTRALSTNGVPRRAVDEGRLVAVMLHRVWAHADGPISLSVEELTRVTPLLLESGGGALGWHRIRETSLNNSIPGKELHEAYRLHSLQAEAHIGKIKKAFALFQRAGLNAVLVKGWAIARLYPDLGLRPYGDIDLCVSRTEFARTTSLLATPSFGSLPIDLHEGFRSFGSDDEEEFVHHSRRVDLDGLEVTVLSPEHHVRALCIHMLRHGAFRPLWLVDIAVALETRPVDFDWELCLGKHRRRAKWVECAIGLAQQLLGARIEDTPVAQRRGRVPRWLVKQVLKSWSNPVPANHGENRHVAPIKKYLHDPRGLAADLRNRWPDPIEATISVGGPLNRMPRLPFQLANCVLRAARFAKHLPVALQEERQI